MYACYRCSLPHMLASNKLCGVGRCQSDEEDDSDDEDVKPKEEKKPVKTNPNEVATGWIDRYQQGNLP